MGNFKNIEFLIESINCQWLCKLSEAVTPECLLSKDPKLNVFLSVDTE